jgi:TonB family protein
VLVDCENLPAAKLIFDVCRRNKGGQSPVPIAIVDGRAGLPTAFRLGAELILTKPVSKDHARSTIRTAVSRVRKEEPTQTTSVVDAPISKTAPEASNEQAAAAVATGAGAAISVTPQVAKILESTPVKPVATEATQSPTLQTIAAVKAAPMPASTPTSQPQSGFAFAPVAKQPVKAPIALKREPEEQLTGDPVLAEIDKVETRDTFSQAPVLSSFGTYQARPAEPKKRRGPVLLLLLLLAGGGFYAAWMYQPGFREMVQPQIDRVMALVGQTQQLSSRPQPNAPVATQNAPVAAPAPAPQEASTGNQTPASDASAAPEAAAAVPGASAAPNETTAAKGTESTDSGEATRSIPLENPPEMDKNVIILSSKGAEKRLISKVAPVYPKQAKASGVEGTLVLKVLVSDSGKVANVSLIEGNPILATAAMHAVRQWRYRPYVRAGKNLAFQTIVLLDFQR